MTPRYSFQRRQRAARKRVILALYPHAACILTEDCRRAIAANGRWCWIGTGATARQAWWAAWLAEVAGSIETTRAAVRTLHPDATCTYSGGGRWTMYGTANHVTGSSPHEAWLTAAYQLGGHP